MLRRKFSAYETLASVHQIGGIEDPIYRLSGLVSYKKNK